MNIYSRKQRWKLILFVIALVIVGASLWYTSLLVEQITQEERAKIERWAETVVFKAQRVRESSVLFDELAKKERNRISIWSEATRIIGQIETEEDRKFLPFLGQIIEDNPDIPVIMTNAQGRITGFRNLPDTMPHDSATLHNEMAFMAEQFKPIEAFYDGELYSVIYYKESRGLTAIKEVFSEMEETFRAEVLGNAATSSVIMTNESRTKVTDYAGNINEAILKDSILLQEELADIESNNPPLEVEVGYNQKRYIFFRESFVLTQLRYFPLVIMGIIGLFMFISYILFSTARKAEQNQVWVGMSKETAHQLGTPLSSLMAWMELLKDDIDASTAHEIDKDIKRLVTVTDRFSKVGSAPVLKDENMVEVLHNSINYMKTRTSGKISFKINASSTVVLGKVNVPLFEWVVENLVRNAVDAMQGDAGHIGVDIQDKGSVIYIDVSDTGKGIAPSKVKTVFQPGFTTKRRGWGLGLSLTKRIVTNYHNGKIFVKKSEVGVGTTFRIILNKA